MKTLKASGLVVPDAATLVLKAPDDLAAIIATRKAAEQQRQEAERERIRQEETARLQREAEASQRLQHEVSTLHRIVDEVQTTGQAVITGNGDTLRTDGGMVRIDLAPRVVPMRAAPAPTERAGTPTLKLGQIAERLGFSLTADFLKGLGFEPAARERGACLFHEADWPLMLAALVRHVEAVQARAAA